jgi:SanA protein
VFKKIVQMIFVTILIILLVALTVLLIPRLITAIYSLPRTYSTDQVPEHKVAIVFGAGLWRDGSPTPVLRDRVETAAKLYFAGKVEKLLMSGDNSYLDYNEPGAMRGYALELGVPDDAIVLDYAGRRTYDTCYRAKHIFGVEEAILVTQAFHMPRALYVCNQLDLDSVGVVANSRLYRRGSVVWWQMRETPATLVALWEVLVTHPEPILGEKEPIFPMETQ